MREIFVFGSNEAGRHGKGAALHARLNHGAIYGIGEGLQGNSYGIPTKSKTLRVLSIDKIKSYINNFLLFVDNNPELTFKITPVGCGLAGYSKDQIRPLFGDLPRNCYFSKEWFKEYKEVGTYK